MDNFTPDDLVQYLYNETSQAKSAAIKKALETDWTLREMYEIMVSAQNRLEALELSPREDAVNNILRHAEKTITELHPH